MPIFVKRSEFEVSREQLFAWHARPGAFERLNPPWSPAFIDSRTGEGLEVGTKLVMRTRIGPTMQRWVAEHTALEPGHSFRDEQRDGPFTKWVHTHRFLDGPKPGTSILEDSIDYELPLGALGAAFGGSFASHTLDAMFAYRHHITQLDLQRHALWSTTPRVFVVTGASGLIGSALIPFLTTGGHTVRRARRGKDNQLDERDFEGADVVVHLAGSGVADERWTPSRKKDLISSRVDFTRQLVGILGRVAKKPSVLLSGSAIGIYGDRGEEELTEASTVGPRGDKSAAFLAGLCQDWEAEGERAREHGLRVALLRTGLVQSSAGGALAKLLTPFRAGVGGPVGNGQHFQSWVSIEDVLGAIAFAAHDDVSGPLNLVGPAPVRFSEYASVLGHVLHRPSFTPVPAFALRLMFGEMADGAILASQRVLPAKLQAGGFSFAHPTLEIALKYTLGQLP